MSAARQFFVDLCYLARHNFESLQYIAEEWESKVGRSSDHPSGPGAGREVVVVISAPAGMTVDVCEDDKRWRIIE